ncbi:pentapeptide repeat-containing protein [Microbulbifer sp. ZKSA006]|uniref:pentapeptide repeat-containing protein n=1 Tax=Microbulbifer sp. ZKSA006 TaxID=3243390 RepID=UPI00403A5B6A
MANFSNMISRKLLVSAASLTRTNFRYSDFEGVHLEKCALSESKFIAVNFSRANLEGSDLTNTEFAPSLYDGLSVVNADLRNADIREIGVIDLDFSGVKIYEWQQASLMESIDILIFPDN